LARATNWVSLQLGQLTTPTHSVYIGERIHHSKGAAMRASGIVGVVSLKDGAAVKNIRVSIAPQYT